MSIDTEFIFGLAPNPHVMYKTWNYKRFQLFLRLVFLLWKPKNYLSTAKNCLRNWEKNLHISAWYNSLRCLYQELHYMSRHVLKCCRHRDYIILAYAIFYTWPRKNLSMPINSSYWKNATSFCTLPGKMMSYLLLT